MTKEELFDAIGTLDEGILDENVEEIRHRRHFGWIGGIAACAAVIAGIAVLPRVLPQGELPHSQAGTQATETAETEPVTEETSSVPEFAGFLDGLHYYPLPEGAAADDVCEEGAWLSPKLGETAYLVLDDNQRLYQFVDPLSSALPETGTYTIENGIITAVSYDGAQSHTLEILDGYAMELVESTSWENLAGRTFTARCDETKPFADAKPEYLRNITCNEQALELDEAQMEEFAAYLREFVCYQEFKSEMGVPDTGEYFSFEWHHPDDRGRYVMISQKYMMDGSMYLADTESSRALFSMLTPLAEEAREESERTPNTLPYLEHVTYRMLDREHGSDSAYNSFSAAIGFDMTITFQSGKYRINYLNPAWEEEQGTYTIADGAVICTDGENTHEFEILNDYTIRFASSSNENITPDNFKDRYFTCRLFPEEYFRAQVPDAQGIRCGSRDSTVQLPEDRISECLDALHELTIYTESIGMLSQERMDTEKMGYLVIDCTGEAPDVQVYIGTYIAIDGRLYVYEKDTAEALFALLEDYGMGFPERTNCY